MTKPDTLFKLVSELVEGIGRSDSQYQTLFRPDLLTHPIPFFGDPTTASVLTVGVNPSAAEFVNREWERELTPSELVLRLVGYFHSNQGPHPWFDNWQQALSCIRSSYRSNAAHLDLSPRATRAMASLVNQGLFRQMVEQDVQWFFELLRLCPRAKVILCAGCVTKRWYMNDFLRRVAPRHGFRLDGECASRGSARVCFHSLLAKDFHLPVYFCSVSPSARNKEALVERTCENSSRIRELMG